MLLHVDGVDGPSFNQESRTMFIIEFGKSCAEGPSVGDENLPGTDDLSVRPFGEIHGPAMQIMAFDTLQDWATVTGVDKATNKSGTVTVATCDWETQCVPGKGQTVKVIPGARPSEDFVPCVDWNISAFIGPCAPVRAENRFRAARRRERTRRRDGSPTPHAPRRPSMFAFRHRRPRKERVRSVRGLRARGRDVRGRSRCLHFSERQQERDVHSRGHQHQGLR
mmetsp:Transcript_27525/g.84968  ORF Transcript_27525/g.84968 Transcript_27525/m.84968 type:complete len:223 (-) Transcript_27525:241-909(-)